MRVVTTYNPNTWEMFAKRNIESMKQIDGELYVYHEQDKDIGDVNKNLFEIPGLLDFLKMVRSFPPAQGKFMREGEIQYNYNFDAHKFCRKVFAIYDAAQDCEDYLVWVDADAEVLKPISQDLIKTWVGDRAVGLFQRKEMHSECGFVIYNLTHPKTYDLIATMHDLYHSGYIFQLPGWHDCWALDVVIDKREVPATNLSPVLSESIDVINESMLKPYLRHDKGQRKFQ